MTTSLLPWLVLAPLLAAALVPAIGAAATRFRSALYAVAHVVVLAVVLAALAEGSENVAVDVQRGPLVLRLNLTLDRNTGLALVATAIIILAAGLFSRAYVRGARNGSVFLSLLLVEQAGAGLALLAGDLVALYAGLLMVSLALTLMIGLDFGAPGAAAALRVFATTEVPAAFAFAGFWLLDARAGTLALSNLARDAGWLRDPVASTLVAPIVVALIARAGLTPLHNWVSAGCRAAAAPAAIALAGVALPLGGVVVGRLAGSLIPLGSIWMDGLAVLGAATAVVAGIGAAREKSALAWLGYLAAGQVGLAIVGFGVGGPAVSLAPWIQLASTAVSISLIGMGVALAIRSTGRDRVDDLGDLVRMPAVRWAFLLGLAALAPLPPFPAFTARRLLLVDLAGRGDDWGLVIAAAVILGTVALAIPVWRVALDLIAGSHLGLASRFGTVDEAEEALPRPAAAWPAEPVSFAAEWSVVGPIAGLSVVNVLLGLPPSSLLLGLPSAGAVPAAAVVVSGIPVILAVGGAPIVEAVPSGRGWAERAGRRASRFVRWMRLEQALDPYVLIGALLLAIGRLSALTLNETLGRLARAR